MSDNEFFGGRRRRRGNGGAEFAPLSLFANGEQGLWYDPSDLTPEKTSWRRNLLTYSQDFDNVIWTKTNSTVSTDAAVAPDGTTTAEKHIPNNTIALTINTASGCPIRRTSAVSGVAAGYSISFSLYAKAAGYNRVIMYVDDGLITKNCVVSLVDGSVVSVSSGSTCTVTNAGNGWYRVDLAFVFTSAGTASGIRFAPQDSVATTGDGTSGIFVWGAQLEQATVASAYQRITDFSSDFLAAFPTHALFQDSAGTTPVTALGQSVGRILDKSDKGNHAIQATSASRPTLQARANLLTYSEQFDNAAWTNVGTPTVTANTTLAPDGTTTADTINDSSAVESQGRRQTVTIPASTTIAYTSSVYILKTSGTPTIFPIVNLRMTGGTTVDAYIALNTTTGATTTSGAVSGSAVDAGTYWRVTLVAANNGTANTSLLYTVFPAGATTLTTTLNVAATGSQVFWGAQVEAASAASTYQRVVTATDYADVGLPRNLLFDGIDDSLATVGNVDFSATDKMSVFSGLTKASDAATGQVLEFSADASLNNGSFSITAPTGAAVTNLRFRSTGTLSSFSTDTSFAAPVTGVITGLSEILTDTCILRKNGAQVATSASDQGTGTYLSYPLYIGRRNNASLPFNGRIFQLIVRGAATDAVTVTNAEQYVAQKTGVTI
jgi:hypothetical protein